MWRALLIVLTVVCLARPAWACGAFGSVAYVKAPPRLGHERTLIVWDSSTKMEHFVREVKFRGAQSRFGFVVPTPSRPTVHDVKDSPFDGLEAYDPKLFSYLGVLGHGSGQGFGSGFGRLGGGRASPPPLTVLEQKKVGDFTAFVIEASDPKALAAWLAKHGLATTEAGTAWIDHYVKLGSYFVALRFDAGKQDEELVSRTLRISFRSELPYYPYQEPEDAKPQENRRLDVWLVSDVTLVPLAGRVRDARWELRRPWSEGARHEPEAGELEEALGPELAPLLPRNRRVQTFLDAKESRQGWHDVVLAFESPRPCDAACEAARLPLLARMDPSLAQSVTLPAVTPNALSCGVSRGRAAEGAFFPLVVLALLFARRRPRLLLLVLAVGCQRAPSPADDAAPPPQPSASSAASTPPPAIEPAVAPSDRAARRQWLLATLSGKVPGMIPVESTPHRGGLGAAQLELPDNFPALEELAERCVPGSVEAVLPWRIEVAEDGKTKSVQVSGFVPKPMTDCVARELGHVLFAPEGGARTERGVLAFSAPDQKAIQVRQALQRSSVQRVVGTTLRVIPSSSSAKGLPKEVVQRILRQNTSRYRLCYERGERSVTGTVALGFDIDARGKSIHVKATGPFPARVLACVKTTTRALTFPKPEAFPASAIASLEFRR